MVKIELLQYFQIRYTQNKLTASIHLKKEVPDEIVLTKNDLLQFLNQQSITYGINEGEVERIASSPNFVEYPIEIAKGKVPVNGDDAYIEWLAPGLKETMEKKELSDNDWIDYRNLMKIPMAKKKEVIAKKIVATAGTPGLNVSGEEVQPRPGKDIRMRAGKNTSFNEETQEIIATMDGQIGVNKNSLSINPVYEVRGDISLETGNIDFIGHVHIRGSVPSGYKIIAGGDIIVEGIVEVSHLEAGGTVYVRNGIIGAQKGYIKAKGNIQTRYINQGVIEADGDVIVEQMIMHSQVTAGGQVICNGERAEIVGGVISSQKKIMVRTLGNDSHTKTKVYLGVNQKMVHRTKEVKETIQNLEETNQKTRMIENKLREKQQQIPLTPEERIMLLRIRNTTLQNKEKLTVLQVEYEELQEVFEKAKDAQLEISGEAFPNVEIVFGKFHEQLQRSYDHVKVKLVDGEIVFSPL